MWYDGLMIVRKTNQDVKLFYVTSADWEAVIEADTAENAMVRAMEKMFSEFEKDFELAPTVLAFDLTGMSNDVEDMDEFCYLGYTPSILADAGQHKLSKQYEQIIQEYE